MDRGAGNRNLKRRFRAVWSDSWGISAKSLGIVLCVSAAIALAPSIGQCARSVFARAPIDTPLGVAQARSAALNDIFGGRLPSDFPSDVIAVTPPRGAQSAVYLVGARGFYLVPKNPAGKLAIYHAGHGERALLDGADSIRDLLANGFTVLAIRMPPKPHKGRSLRDFLGPVAVGLNYAMAQRQFSEVVMFGISGGGWTTAVYSALDTRITRSVPVAGTWPDELRLRDVGSRGDYEQQLPGLSVDYPTLYVLAASEGRESVQVFNSDDPCCFAGTAGLSYRAEIARKAAGRFDVVVMDNNQHTISTDAMQVVLGD